MSFIILKTAPRAFSGKPSMQTYRTQIKSQKYPKISKKSKVLFSEFWLYRDDMEVS